MFITYFTFLWCAGFCGYDVYKERCGWAVFFAFLALYNLIILTKES